MDYSNYDDDTYAGESSMTFTPHTVPPPTSVSQAEASTAGKPTAFIDQEYTVGRCLKAPRVHTFSVQGLFDQLEKGYIDVSPDYQRDVVWKQDRQEGLIESLFKNYYVPPILFCGYITLFRSSDRIHMTFGAATCMDKEGAEFKTCMDGKQRLTSIQSETDDILWFTDNQEVKIRGLKRLLPQRLRDIFCSKQISCVEYEEISDDDQRDIFIRVQKGMALTGPEKLRAMGGPRREFIDALVKKHVTEDGLRHKEVGWGSERAKDFQCFSYATVAISRWDADQGLKTFLNASSISSWLDEKPKKRKRKSAARGRKKAKPSAPRQESSDVEMDDEEDEEHRPRGPVAPVPEALRGKVEDTYQLVVALARDQRYNRAFRPLGTIMKVSPIEMIGIPLLVYALHTSRSPLDEDTTASTPEHTKEELCQLIMIMRRLLHKTYPYAVKINYRVGKSMVDFCLEASKDAQGTIKKYEEALGGGPDMKEAGDDGMNPEPITTMSTTEPSPSQGTIPVTSGDGSRIPVDQPQLGPTAPSPTLPALQTSPHVPRSQQHRPLSSSASQSQAVPRALQTNRSNKRRLP
ncbi:hypothetical protein AAF712_016113 [Marasmius tenuissimus]|uniref:GmrSD restriction endonucleases N-terminal domain-containing protein n=1 Tax=Marasmius tenuissimus TaxID=585030 RepID=A0ABR2Z6S3_9AGAR